MTEEQVKYELQVRGKNVGDMEADGSLVDQLQTILDTEAEAQKDPLDWTLDLTPAQKDQELADCINSVKELRRRFDEFELDDTMQWDNFVISRLVHNDYRLKRIQYEGTSEETRLASKKQEVTSQWITRMFTQYDVERAQPPARDESVQTIPPQLPPPLPTEVNQSDADRMNDRSNKNGGPQHGTLDNTYSAFHSPTTFRSSEFCVRQTTPPHPTNARSAAAWARAQDIRIVMTQLTNAEEELRQEFKRAEPREDVMNSLLHRLKISHDQVNEITRNLTVSEEETAQLAEDVLAKWEQLDRWAVSKIVSEGRRSKTNASSTLRDNVKDKKKTGVPFDTYIDEIGFDNCHEIGRSRRGLSQKSVTFEEDNGTAKHGKTDQHDRPTEREEVQMGRLWPSRNGTDTTFTVGDDFPRYSGRSERSYGHGGSTPWQQQMQALSKAMGHRRFDGENKDQKLLSVNEFIGLLRMYQRSARISDEVLISAVPTQMTGLAFQWWATVGPNIETFDELERAVRMRFEHREMDKISQILHVSARKQSRSERLADYVDDMCQLAYTLEDRMTEQQLVKLIVKNSNSVCRQQLVAHQYKSVESLRNYINYLGANGLITVEPTEKKTEQRPKWMKPKYVNATERKERETSSASEGDRSGDESEAPTEENQALLVEKVVAAVAKVFEKSKFDRKANSYQKKESKTAEAKPTRGSDEIPAEQMMTEVRCFGCQAPGVFRRNCTTCNPNLTKNDPADL